MVQALGEVKTTFDGEEWVRASKVVEVLDRAQENIEHRHETIEHFKRQTGQLYNTATKTMVDQLASNFKADWERLSNFNEAIEFMHEVEAALVEIQWQDGWEEESTLKKVLHLVYEKQHYAKRAAAQAATIARMQDEIDELKKHPPDPDRCFHCLGKGGFPKPGGYSLQCPECFGLAILLPKSVKGLLNLLQERITASGLNVEMVNRTFVIEHNPNCPKSYLVRLPHHGEIDKKVMSDTQDNYGYGNSPNEAYADALKMHAGRK